MQFIEVKFYIFIWSFIKYDEYVVEQFSIKNDYV